MSKFDKNLDANPEKNLVPPGLGFTFWFFKYYLKLFIIDWITDANSEKTLVWIEEEFTSLLLNSVFEFNKSLEYFPEESRKKNRDPNFLEFKNLAGMFEFKTPIMQCYNAIIVIVC